MSAILFDLYGTGGANVKCLVAGTYVLTVNDLLTNPTLTIALQVA